MLARNLTARFLHLALAASLLSPLAATAAPHVATYAASPVAEPDAEPMLPLPVRAAPERAAVRAALAARREHNLSSFRIYRNKGVYPHNMVRPGPLNVWRDPEGHFCAAATILYNDGQRDLVLATAKQSNFIRLLDVTEGPLMDWMLTSGLTIEEIDRIQVPGFEAPRQEPDNHTAEDARLRKDYAATDAALGKPKATAAALETATDRLMEHPDLAWELLDRVVSPGA